MYLVPGRAALESDGGKEGPPPPPPDSGIHVVEAGAPEGGTTCAVEHQQPEPQPLGIYIIVNQSTSMSTLWSPLVQALATFIADSGSQPNVSAGVQYFALSPDPSSIFPGNWAAKICQASSYVDPDVPIAELPGNELSLVTSLNRHGPDYLNSIFPGLAQIFLNEGPADVALTGAIEGARQWYAAHENLNPRAVVLLVTDGVPSSETSPSCQPTLDTTVAAARDGLSGTPSISTYVLGVGAQLTDLDQVAAAGGTRQAHLVASTAPADIANELQAVRSEALPCDFQVESSWLWTDRVNVDLVESGSSGKTRFSRVLGPENCASDGGAPADQWFALDPDRVVLCPATCNRVRGVAGVSLDIIYGCPTVEAK